MSKQKLNRYSNDTAQRSMPISEKRLFKNRYRFFSNPKKIIAFSLMAVIIALIVWDIIDSPPIWHFRQADKQAIIQYQRQHYPGAKVVKRNFPFLGNPGLVGSPVESSMTFEYDGVEFFIAAQNGELTRDFFPYANAKLQIVNKIDEFMRSRGIENSGGIKVDVMFNLLHVRSMLYPFDDPPTEDLSKYNHRVNVEITVNGEYDSPKDVGWLYYCYQYWITECVLPDYSLTFKVVSNDKRVYNACLYTDSKITSEKNFYSQFYSY